SDSLNRRLLAFQLRLVTRILRFRSPILWSYVPNGVPLADAVGARAAVYFRTDDYTSIPGIVGPAMARAEREAVARADLCVAPARRYFDGPLRSARRRLWLPNAVELDQYAGSLPPDPYASVARPVLLMVGTLESWVATDLLD